MINQLRPCGIAPRTRMLFAVLAVGAALLVMAASASASIGGGFCTEKFLSSGASCHSPNYHSFFEDVEGDSNGSHPTCVGIDISPSGGNLVNVCASHGVACISQCTGYSGYAYVHNHGTIGDYYYGYLYAAS